MEHSTHLDRDKVNNDPLEHILEPWGVYRQWGVSGLSSSSQSPIAGLNQLEKAFTKEIDRRKRAEIREAFVKLNYKGEDLKQATAQAFREWTWRIERLNVPRETKTVKPVSPNYGGHRYYSAIDKLLAEIHPPYYNILIHKYEHNWQQINFVETWGWTVDKTKDKICRARGAARRILKLNNRL